MSRTPFEPARLERAKAHAKRQHEGGAGRRTDRDANEAAELVKARRSRADHSITVTTVLPARGTGRHPVEVGFTTPRFGASAIASQEAHGSFLPPSLALR